MFILKLNANSPDELKARFNEYYEYLETIQNLLPPEAYGFAIASWHYDPEDARCPHDSWVECLSIRELSSGVRREKREIEINLRLLNAQHNQYLDITYKAVKGYNFNSPLNNQMSALSIGHGDWLIDEVRLSDKGQVLHEVIFSTGTHWLIECGDIIYSTDALNK